MPLLFKFMMFTTMPTQLVSALDVRKLLLAFWCRQPNRGDAPTIHNRSSQGRVGSSLR
jgi:hypothetical protein